MFIGDFRILCLLPWLIMRVSFNIKGSKPKPSVNRLSHMFPLWSFVVLVMNSQNFDRFFPCFLQVVSVLSETLNWMATSLLGLFLLSSFSASYFVLKVVFLCFLFMSILNTMPQRLSFTHYSPVPNNSGVLIKVGTGGSPADNLNINKQKMGSK